MGERYFKKRKLRGGNWSLGLGALLALVGVILSGAHFGFLTATNTRIIEVILGVILLGSFVYMIVRN